MALCAGGFWLLSGAVSVPGSWAAIIPLFMVLFTTYAFAVLRISGKKDKETLLSVMPEGLRKIASKIMGRPDRTILIGYRHPINARGMP